MRVTMRLYKTHDLDLIALYKNPQFHFNQAMRMALSSVLSGKTFWIEPPKNIPDTSKVSRIVQIPLSISDKDTELIRLIQKIKKGLRNSYLKNLLRGFILCPSLEAYYETTPIPLKSIWERELISFSIKKQYTKNKSKKTDISQAINEAKKGDNVAVEDIPSRPNPTVYENAKNDTQNKESSFIHEESKKPTENKDDFDMFEGIEEMLNQM